MLVRCNKAEDCEVKECPHRIPHEPKVFEGLGWDNEVITVYSCTDEPDTCNYYLFDVICKPIE